MHKFFIPRDGVPPAIPEHEPSFLVPDRVYARLIDGEASEFVLFDAVAAEDFDRFLAVPVNQLQPGAWRNQIDNMKIFAIEINASDTAVAAAAWLRNHPIDALPDWSQIELVPDRNGEAAVYDNISGPPERARLSVRPVSKTLVTRLHNATDLSAHEASETEIEAALPTDTIEHVFVLDVGQGSANALVRTGDDVIAYVDLGAGVLKDTGTWPPAMNGICLLSDPKVILTHWHYDHFQAANKYHAALNRVWIAPKQILGPGPQSAMAGAIAKTGKLMVWNGSGILQAGKIELERCTGPSNNQNRSGIAVWVCGPPGTDPILMPGDAGYGDIPSLAAGKPISGLVVAHHGGHSPGSPPLRPSMGQPRAAFSYGQGNSYSHPLAKSLAALKASNWHVGHPAAGIDERRTEDRPHIGTSLGHIRLNWSGNFGPPRNCACNCTIEPTQ